VRIGLPGNAGEFHLHAGLGLAAGIQRHRSQRHFLFDRHPLACLDADNHCRRPDWRYRGHGLHFAVGIRIGHFSQQFLRLDYDRQILDHGFPTAVLVQADRQFIRDYFLLIVINTGGGK